MFRHFESPDANRCGPHRAHAHFARFGFGRPGGPREHFGRGFGGGGRERMFDNGEFQLVLLHLLAQKPSYGYELIKTMEEKLAGGYAPSPGVVYPTLTLLEEEGLTSASTVEGNRKVYTVTDAGRQHLEANKARLDEILARLGEAGEGFERGNAPQIMRSFRNLRRAVLFLGVRNRDARKPLTADQLRAVTDAIDAAAKTIDAL